MKLELVSCDGGEHIDPRHPAQFLGVKNVLRHDKSVYCSERPSTSIVLRHADDTPFCLEKLHVVGPEHGFTAPVREGLVYVGMTMDDLKKYMDPPPWARREGLDAPPYMRNQGLARSRRLPPPPRRTFFGSLRSSPERLSLSDALRDPEVNAALESRERTQALIAEAANDLNSPDSGYYGEDFGFGRTDPEAHCDIPSISSSSDGPDVVVNPDGEHVPVTVLSDEDAGPEETSTQDVLDFRLQRLRLMRRRYELDSWDHEDRWSGLNGLRFETNGDREREGSNTLSRLDALMSRARMRDTPGAGSRSPPPAPSSGDHYLSIPDPTSSFSAPGDEPEPAASAAADDPAADDPNVRGARFSIKKGKHKVAIRFDPPISGRFMLLKLWANRSNVDVQSVIAKGFGGPRYFIARELA